MAARLIRAYGTEAMALLEGEGPVRD